MRVENRKYVQRFSLAVAVLTGAQLLLLAVIGLWAVSPGYTVVFLLIVVFAAALVAWAICWMEGP